MSCIRRATRRDATDYQRAGRRRAEQKRARASERCAVTRTRIEGKERQRRQRTRERETLGVFLPWWARLHRLDCTLEARSKVAAWRGWNVVGLLCQSLSLSLVLCFSGAVRAGSGRGRDLRYNSDLAQEEEGCPRAPQQCWPSCLVREQLMR